MGEEIERTRFQNKVACERHYRRFLLRVGWVLAALFFCICIHCSNTPIAHAARIAHTVGESATSVPAAGPTQTTITVSGSGWLNVPDGTAVTFGYSTDPSCASAYTAATIEQPGSTSGGTFTGWFRWPDATPTGTYTVCATISTAVTPAGSYTVLASAPPKISISAATFTVGQQATITGSNFLPPQTSVILLLQKLNGGTSMTLGTVASDTHGAFSRTYTIPNNPTGPVALIANSGNGTPPIMSASVTFIVYVTPTPTPKATPTPVPPQKSTGGSVTTPIVIQTQGHTQAIAPAQTSTTASSRMQGKPQTPGHEFTQTSPATTPATGSSHSWLLIALLAGTLFLLLLTAIAALFLWKKRRRQHMQRAIHSTITSDGRTASNWVPAQDPFAKKIPLDQQKAEQSQTRYPQRVPHPGNDKSPLYAATHPGNGTGVAHPGDDETLLVGSRSRSSHPEKAFAAIPPPTAHSASAAYKPATPVQATGDLLRDPLLEAIMQQARSGLFVLPGKGE